MKFKTLPVILASTLLIFPLIVLTQDEKPAGFLGIGLENAKNIPAVKGKTFKSGVRVIQVVYDSAADKSGFKEGDIVVAVNGAALDCPPDNAVDFYINKMKEFHPGDKVKLTVIRGRLKIDAKDNTTGMDLANASDIVSELEKYLEKNPAADLEIYVKKDMRIFEIEATLGYRPGQEPGANEFPWGKIEYKGDKPAVENYAEYLAEKAGIMDNYSNLKKQLAKLGDMNDGFRLFEPVFLQKNPFQIQCRTEGLERSIRTGDPINAAFAVQQYGTIEYKPWNPLKTGISGEAHLAQIEELLNSANISIKAAFSDFSKEDMAFAREKMPSLYSAFEQFILIGEDPDKVRLKNHLNLVRMSQKIKYEKFHECVCSICSLIQDKNYVLQLKADLQKSGLDITAPIVLQKDTPFGKIIIGGTGNNSYRSDAPNGADAAVIIDLGGDDMYKNNAGGSTAKIPCAVVIDLSGNDVYESTDNGAQGAGILGVGVLLDYAGNDSYIGMRLCQGASAMGVGALIDHAGNDTYRSRALSQGFALWGVALLDDKDGDDSYEGDMMVQGVGAPKGVGILNDRAGNDKYYAKGMYQTSYGNPGVFEGWSQGIGIGFRQIAAGGIGFLRDGGGSDVYEGGCFAQGGGYYFGWGILYDASNGNDVYIGSRYNQGFAAHQALGSFIDEGGDDKYLTRCFVHAGLSWDETIVLFIDKGGNDYYGDSEAFSLGATAHNAISIFEDLGGKDVYDYRNGPACAGTNEYHGGGISLSLFFDLGGAEDTYKTKISNNFATWKKDFGFIVDAPFSALDNPAELDKILQAPKPDAPKPEK
jgi:hypothetical protein